MYPTLHSSSNHSISSLASSHSAHTQPGVDQSQRFSANEPSTSGSASSTVFNVLRVRVADALSITPPVSTQPFSVPVLRLHRYSCGELLCIQVMLSTHLGNIPRTEHSQSFEYEHQVLRDYPLNSQAPSADSIPHTTAADVQRYTQMGHSREAVAMALVAVQGTEDRDTQVLCCCVLIVENVHTPCFMRAFLAFQSLVLSLDFS